METILISDILLFVIATFALFIACITDIKKQEVANWLNFSLLAIALGIRIIAAIITLQFYYFFYAIIAFVLFFILANILYYGKFFGGGDAKLLMAISVVFATSPSFYPLLPLLSQNAIEEPFLLSFLVNLFTIGSVYSLVFIGIFAIKNRTKFVPEFKKIHKETKMLRTIFLMISAIALALSLFYSIFLLVFFSAILFPYLYILAKATENSSMIKTVMPQALKEGDWLMHAVKLKNKTIRPSIHGLNAKDIEALKKAKKRVVIKYGIPFVPVFLLALIATLFFQNLIFLAIKALFF